MRAEYANRAALSYATDLLCDRSTHTSISAGGARGGHGAMLIRCASCARALLRGCQRCWPAVAACGGAAGELARGRGLSPRAPRALQTLRSAATPLPSGAAPRAPCHRDANRRSRAPAPGRRWMGLVRTGVVRGRRVSAWRKRCVQRILQLQK